MGNGRFLGFYEPINKHGQLRNLRLSGKSVANIVKLINHFSEL